MLLISLNVLEVSWNATFIPTNFITLFILCIISVQLLDNLAGQKPQLTALELFMLSTSVAAAASGPWILGGKLTEFLAPTAAACEYFTLE